MNKTELAAAVGQKMELTGTWGHKAVNAVLEAIETALRRGETVTIPGFGKFDLMESKARKGYNPRTKQPVDIPAKTSIKFRPAVNLKEAVNAPQNV